MKVYNLNCELETLPQRPRSNRLLKLHCSDLWVHLSRLATRSKQRKAAVAYASNDSEIRFRNGDTVIVDASEGAIRTGQTSALVLQRAFDNGAQVFTCPDLHAKVYVFDRTAIIGSANVSASSAKRLLEAAVITDEPSIVSAARKLVGQLQEKSQRLDRAGIQKLLLIPVSRRFPIMTGQSRAPKVNPEPGVTWLVATHDLDSSRYGKEEKLASEGLYKAEQRLSKTSSEADWIRFSKKSSIARQAKVDDWVIQMRRPKRDGGPARVHRPAPVRYIQKEPTCVRIYLEAFRNSDSGSLGWRWFHKMAKDAGIHERRLGKGSIGTLTESQADVLESLWGAWLKENRE